MYISGKSMVDANATLSGDLVQGEEGTESERSAAIVGCFIPHNQPPHASSPDIRAPVHSLHTSNTSDSFLDIAEDGLICHYCLSLAAPSLNSIQLDSRHLQYTYDYPWNHSVFQSMERGATFSPRENTFYATLNDGGASKPLRLHEQKSGRRRVASMPSSPWALHSSGSSQERAILEFLASANGACPFVMRVTAQQSFTTEGRPHIHLQNYPTSLSHPKAAVQFCLQAEDIELRVQSLRFLAAELCLALLFLHRNGIVHQDIKPTNIMVSREGHATLGGFSAARFVRPPDCPSREKFGCSTANAGPPKYRADVLPLGESDYLSLANTDCLLEELERFDWRCLGMSLCEVITGGTLAEDLEILQKQIKIIEDADVHLLHFLQSLIIRSPTVPLRGEAVLSHAFFDNVRELWDEIEDLQHPPCHLPSLYFDLRSHAVSKVSGHTAFSLHEQKPSCDTSTESTSFPTNRSSHLSTSSLVSPTSSQCREEALAVARPTVPIFGDTNRHSNPRVSSYDPEPFLNNQGIHLFSNHLTPNSGIDTTSSIVEPCISTTHMIAFFQNSSSRPTLLEEIDSGEYGHCDIVLDSTERSFNDSGLDFPSGESPWSWGPSKYGESKKLERLQQVETRDDIPPSSQPTVELLPPIFLESQSKPAIPAEKGTNTDDWSLDQKIAISLLCAGKGKGNSERERQSKLPRFGKIHLIAKASAKAFLTIKRRVLNFAN